MEEKSMLARMTITKPQLVQLYSASTANGIKVHACLEELVALRANTGDPFDFEPHTVDIRKHESRSAWYLDAVSPNAKIPAIMDPAGPDGKPVQIFESGAILKYLAEKYGELYPRDAHGKVVCDSWLFWGSASFSPACKTFGFYYEYATVKDQYCMNRNTKAVHRLLKVLDTHLQSVGNAPAAPYICGELYTIADLSIWPWVYALLNNYSDAGLTVFKQLEAYPAVRGWYGRIMQRPASAKALNVCPFFN